MDSIPKTAGALLCLFTLMLGAQEHIDSAATTARLSGTVSDSSSGSPVAGAVIAFPELRISVSSDVNGAFIVDSMVELPHFMVLSAKGYATRRVAFTTAELSAPLKITLSPGDMHEETGRPAESADDGVSAMSGSDNEIPTRTQPAVPEPHHLAGKIIDKKTGLPVPDAIISVAGRTTAVSSNPEGAFTIDAPATSPCTLTVTKAGYERTVFPVDPEMADVAVEIVLRQSSVYELQELDVNAGRLAVRQTVGTSEKISRVTMSPEIVSRLPNLGQADLFRSLQLLPGVNGTNETSSGLYVRGGTPDQNLIVLDRMPIYYVDHFYGFFSAFNPRAIGELTLYKGGFGAQWGGRLSSVVELSSNGGEAGADSGKIVAGAGTGLLCSDAFVKIPLGNDKTGTLMIAGRRAMTEIFKSEIFNRLFGRLHGTDTLNVQPGDPGKNGPVGGGYGDRIVYQPEFFFWDVNTLAAFRLGSRGKLATTFFASHDRQDNSLDTSWVRTSIIPDINYIKDSIPYRMDTLRLDTSTTTTVIRNKAPLVWGNLCIGQEWEQQWSDAFKTGLNLSYSQFLDEKSENFFRTDSTADRYSDMTSPRDTTVGAASWMTSTNKITDFSGRFDNTMKLSAWNTLRAGVELSRKVVSYQRDTIQPDTTGEEWQWRKYTSTMQQPVHSNDTSLSWAVYAEDEMMFGDHAGLTPGLRLYHFGLADGFAFDPRVSAWYKPLPGVKIKGAWGMYTQEIHRVEEENITGGSKFVWLLSGPSSRPLEKSRQVIGGASWENSHVLIDAEAYFKRFDGLLTISERMRMSSGLPFDPDQLALFEGTGIAKGVELLAQIRNARFTLFSKNAAYDGWVAYTWSRVENTYSVFNNGNSFPATQDHTHEVKLVNCLEWKTAPWSSINLSAVWLYSTGAPYTAPLGIYNLTLLDSLWGRTYMHVSDKNAYRLPDYHRLDVSAAWIVRIGKHVHGRLTAGLFNAYNHENILERSYTATTVGGSNGSFKLPDFPGMQTTVYTAVDRKAMSAMPNIALEVTVKF